MGSYNDGNNNIQDAIIKNNNKKEGDIKMNGESRENNKINITRDLQTLIQECYRLEEELHQAGQEIGQLQDALAITQKAFQLICKEFEDSELNWFTPGGNSLEFTYMRKAQRELERNVNCGI